MSDNNFPSRLAGFDELIRSDHAYPTEDDICYFIGEYTAQKGFALGATNSLVLNLKKPMDRRDRPEWRQKEEAIRTAAGALRTALGSDALDHLTFVPVPPSRSKGDCLHDDRLTRVLKAVRPWLPLKLRELVIQTESTKAAHDSDERPRPEEFESLYRIDEGDAEPEPRKIALVGDVLATGAHFRAAQSLLSRWFPHVAVCGLFLARRVSGASDFDNIGVDDI